MNYEYVYTPDILDETLFEIRDVKEYPVLYTAAVLEDVDILVITAILMYNKRNSDYYGKTKKV